MKKVTRFEALAKGIAMITTPIKKAQVNNVIEKSRLSSELAITECDADIEKAAAELVSSPKESNLTKLSDLMQERDELVAAMDLANKIKAYLDEEIEVEDEKEKKSK